MHISNFIHYFYSRRGHGSYGSLWKVQNIWGEFFTSTCLHHECNADFALGSAFISWGRSVTIKILERSYLTEVSDVRSELPVWSQWEEQVDVHKGFLSLTIQYVQMSEEVFVTFLHTSQTQKCIYPQTTTAHNPQQITWLSEARI